jgi:glycosyltransferase involved in cell wall biosynthesis
MKKVIFLSHEASLSGAPRSLLNLSKFFNKSGDYKLFFLFGKSGPLINDFKKLGKTYSLDYLNKKNTFIYKVFKRIFPLYRLRNTALKIQIKLFKGDIIISNTIVNSNLLDFFGKINLKLITIVRELDGVIELYDNLSLNNSSLIIDKTTHFIAVSNAVKKILVGKYKVPPQKIDVIYNSLPFFKKTKITNEQIDHWKKVNNIPKNKFLVGACGGPIWRKGPDLFLNIIKAVVHYFPEEEMYFIWQGGKKNNYEFLNFKKEITLLGISNNVQIITESNEIHFFYNAINVLMITSREEPFGLTILESALYKKPVLAFRKSGGPEEILKLNEDLLIPYADFFGAAKKLVSLKNNSQKYKLYTDEIYNFYTVNKNQNNFLKYKQIIDSFIK